MHASRLFAVAILALCACAAPRARTAPRLHASRPLTERQRSYIERAYYMAFLSYQRGDYADAHGYLDDILRIDPRERNALALRQRVAAVERLDAKR